MSSLADGALGFRTAVLRALRLVRIFRLMRLLKLGELWASAGLWSLGFGPLSQGCKRGCGAGGATRRRDAVTLSEDSRLQGI